MIKYLLALIGIGKKEPEVFCGATRHESCDEATLRRNRYAAALKSLDDTATPQEKKRWASREYQTPAAYNNPTIAHNRNYDSTTFAAAAADMVTYGSSSSDCGSSSSSSSSDGGSCGGD